MDKPTPAVALSPQFVETEWSLVLQASNKGAANNASMAQLCRRYWMPLYAYVRRRGFSHHDAEDLTQGFFAHVLGKGSLAEADPARGRFRTFLLTALRNFVSNQYNRSSAEKRGGSNEFVSFDLLSQDPSGGWADRPDLNPDQVFDRTWALSILEQSLRQLEALLVSEGKAKWFNRVRPFLQIGNPVEDYESIAREFGMTKNSVAVAIHRLNHRYRDLVRATVAETVASRGDADAELNHLLESLVR